ncbi:YveK family protein [Glutamicibacter protophormiae]|uniref:YveK family protein n=1 Tax=Glutamicibacter protophormiae TaxID=37930 RepID=UPI00332A23F1
MASEESVNINIFWIILKRYFPLILIFTLVFTVAGAALAFFLPKTYTASARVNISPIVSDPFNPTRSASGLLDITTEEAMASSWVVAKRAAQELGDSTPVMTIRQNTIVQADINATTVTISYSAGSDDKARAGADAIANSYLDFRQQQADARKTRISDQLKVRIDSLRPDFDAASDDAKPVIQDQISTIERQLNQLALIDTNGGSVLNPASETGIASEPSKRLFVAGGAVFGLAAGCIAAFAMHRLSRKTRDENDIQLSGFPGPIPKFNAPTTPHDRPTAHQLDLYRTLRERVLDFTPSIRNLVLVDLGNQGLASRLGPQIAAAFAHANQRVELLVLAPLDEDFPWGLEPYDFRIEQETSEAVFYSSAIIKELSLVLAKPDSNGLAPDPVVTNFVRERMIGSDETITRIVTLPRGAFESSKFSAVRLADAVVILVPFKATLKSELHRFQEMISDLKKPVLELFGVRLANDTKARHMKKYDKQRLTSEVEKVEAAQEVNTP